jgi:hypothetical protein
MRNVAAFALAAWLAACSQSGSSTIPSGRAPGIDGRATVRPHTTAFGFVYDDPSGKPLAGIPVRIAPWKGCIEVARKVRVCPADLPFHTFTNAKGRFELRDVPNGRYLLIVGTDNALDFTRATVHDDVTFNGGVQRLVAPTLPRQPLATAPFPSPHPVSVPPIERSGNYRLASIDQSLEFPCLSAANHERAARRFPAFVLDEWLTENVRAIAAYRKTLVRGARVYRTEPIFSGTSVTGGTNCKAALVEPAFTLNGAPQLAFDPRSLWYAGEFLPPRTPGQPGLAHGIQLFGPDPRAYQNPAYPPWP